MENTFMIEKQGDYVLIHPEFVRWIVPTLSGPEISLLLLLYARSEDMHCGYLVRGAARILSLSVTSVQRAYRGLEEKKLIERAEGLVELCRLPIDRALTGALNICWRCGDTEVAELLEVHHMDRDHSNNAPENLVMLCPNCHAIDTKGVERLHSIGPDWAIKRRTV